MVDILENLTKAFSLEDFQDYLYHNGFTVSPKQVYDYEKHEELIEEIIFRTYKVRRLGS